MSLPAQSAQSGLFPSTYRGAVHHSAVSCELMDDKCLPDSAGYTWSTKREQNWKNKCGSAAWLGGDTNSKTHSHLWTLTGCNISAAKCCPFIPICSACEAISSSARWEEISKTSLPWSAAVGYPASYRMGHQGFFRVNNLACGVVK